jgi:NADPH:quinone reductase-like Zn-dependent oxidoreductase
MKAAVRSKYGSAQVLRIKEVEIPAPKENEVLIRVYATTVNRSDCHVLSGKPLVMRLFTGLSKPKVAITGSDFAGKIEATGRNVTTFKAGDKVMGFGGVFGCGSHAQYLILPETKGMVCMPDTITYEQAAACLEGAFYAACTIHKLQPHAGQKALVYGATGAIGSSMVQFLKFYGVSVTAVCRGEHSELMKSLGAHKIIDNTKEDFTKDSERYDFVLDAVGKTSFMQCKSVLKKKGVYTSSEGFINLFWALVTPLFGGKKVVFYPPKNIKEELRFIRDLLQKGQFRPVIDRIYPIEKIADAFAYAASGQKVGNVVITMK